jgi:hypothetical protein
VPVVEDPDAKGFGTFRGLPAGFADSRTLADELEQRCKRHFGHPARTFVAKFTADPALWVAVARRRMDEFRREARVPDEGWEQRFAMRFALAYAAAGLAIRFKVLPWRERQVLDAIVECYRPPVVPTLMPRCCSSRCSPACGRRCRPARASWIYAEP